MLGAEFVWGRVCQGPSLLGAEMSRNPLKSRLSSANSLASEDSRPSDTGRSLMKQRNIIGPRTVPCGTPGVASTVTDLSTSSMIC